MCNDVQKCFSKDLKNDLDDLLINKEFFLAVSLLQIFHIIIAENGMRMQHKIHIFAG